MTSQPPGEITATAKQRIGWAILILITLYSCYFSHLGVVGFVGPDEPRYAWIARDMAETGDWVTPRLYGKPWFEKPVLYYWGAALCFKVFGASEAAARLPSAISALLATLALAWLAWRTYGEECARWLLLLLPTCVAMIGFSHAATTDMPFAGMLTMAMVCAAVTLGLTHDENTPILPQTPWVPLLLFGFFLGLAVLAKGPAAVILAGGSLFVWAIFMKRWRDTFRLLHPIATASFAVTALPWYMLCAYRNPDFFRVFILEHNFKRFLTPEFRHIQPFWYYVPIICIALLPWTFSAVSLVKVPAAGLHRSSVERAIAWLALCWFVWPLLFFSASQSKLPGYILPAVPPAILLAVGSIFRKQEDSAKKTRSASLVIAATLLASGMAFAVMHRKIAAAQDLFPAPWQALIFSSLLLGGVISAVLALRKRTTASFLSSVAALLFALTGLYEGLHSIDSAYSARASFLAMRAIDPNFDALSAAAYQLPRASHFGLNYYLRREIPDWSPASESAQWVFTTYEKRSQIENAGFKCVLYTGLPAVIPCRSSPSLDGLGRGRQAQ